MKRRYELTVIFSPELSSSELNKAQKVLEDSIKKNEGKVIKKDEWGMRDLAYAIEKQTKGVYVFYVLELLPKFLKEVDHQIKLSSGVLRCLFIREE